MRTIATLYGNRALVTLIRHSLQIRSAMQMQFTILLTAPSRPSGEEHTHGPRDHPQTLHHCQQQTMQSYFVEQHRRTDAGKPPGLPRSTPPTIAVQMPRSRVDVSASKKRIARSRIQRTLSSRSRSCKQRGVTSTQDRGRCPPVHILEGLRRIARLRMAALDI